jgi:hypothetical protein
MDQVRQFLREDDSRESRALLAKLIEDKGVDDLLLALADVLKEYIQVGVTDGRRDSRATRDLQRELIQFP